MTDNNLEGYDAVLELPEYLVPRDDNPITTRLRLSYEHILHDLLEDIKGMPAYHHYVLMAERIAKNYIIMQARENGLLGGTSMTAIQQKEFNTWWLATMQAFMKEIKKKGPEEARQEGYEDGLKRAYDIIARVLHRIDNDKAIKLLLDEMNDEFEKAGM